MKNEQRLIFRNSVFSRTGFSKIRWKNERWLIFEMSAKSGVRNRTQCDMDTLTLYELSGKADLRFSPFCWRARLAIAHKGLPVRYVPVAFTDKKTIAFSGQKRVPVLVDGPEIVSDSWKIAS